MSTPRTIPELDDLSSALSNTHYLPIHKDGTSDAERVPWHRLRSGSGYNRKHVAAGASVTHPDISLITVEAIGIADPTVDGIAWYHKNITQNKGAGTVSISGTPFNTGDLIFIHGIYD